jgi:hypothetical protein
MDHELSSSNLFRDQLTIPQFCTPICIPTEIIVDHILEHQQTIRLRTVIEVLISEVLSLNIGKTKS